MMIEVTQMILDRIGRLDGHRLKELPKLKMPGVPLSPRTHRMPFAISACSRAVCGGNPVCGQQASYEEAALEMLEAAEIWSPEILVGSRSSDRWCRRGRVS